MKKMWLFCVIFLLLSGLAVAGTWTRYCCDQCDFESGVLSFEDDFFVTKSAVYCDSCKKYYEITTNKKTDRQYYKDDKGFIHMYSDEKGGLDKIVVSRPIGKKTFLGQECLVYACPVCGKEAFEYFGPICPLCKKGKFVKCGTGGFWG